MMSDEFNEASSPKAKEQRAARLDQLAQKTSALFQRPSNPEDQATPGPGHVPLSPEQKNQMVRVRRLRSEFVRLLQELGGTTGVGDVEPRMGSANLTLALRHLEDAEYRAVRHITGGPR